MNTSRKRMNKKWRIWAIVALLAIGSMIAALIWKTTSPKYGLSMLTVETAEDDEEILNVYAYDLDQEASHKVFSVSCSASHPAAVYDAVNQYVYYSGKTREKLYHDQLIRHDCRTGADEVIVDTLLQIVDLYLMNEGTLVILAQEDESSAVQPYLYDPADGSMRAMGLDGEAYSGANYDSRTGELIICGYAEQDRADMEEREIEATNEERYDPVTGESMFTIENRIYLWRDQLETIAAIETGSIPVVVKDEDRIIYGKSDEGFGDLQFEKIEGKERRRIDLDEDIVDLAGLDGAQLICIARGGGTEGAYGYDLDQQKFVKTYYFNADESVCSVQLIRQR